MGEALSDAAADFAAQAHGTQTRKDGVTPYMDHLRDVARILAVEGGVTDPEIIAAGYLHDCIEDQGVMGETLEEMFGPRVRALVEAVSDDKSLDKQARKNLQVAHARHSPADVALLKMADKIANLRDLVAAPPADWSDARRAEYVVWAGDVVDGLRGRGSPAHLKLERAFDQAAAKARTTI